MWTSVSNRYEYVYIYKRQGFQNILEPGIEHDVGNGSYGLCIY